MTLRKNDPSIDHDRLPGHKIAVPTHHEPTDHIAHIFWRTDPSERCQCRRVKLHTLTLLPSLLFSELLIDEIPLKLISLTPKRLTAYPRRARLTIAVPTIPGA